MIYRILIAIYATLQLSAALGSDTTTTPTPQGVASVAGVAIDLRSELAAAITVAELASAALELCVEAAIAEAAASPDVMELDYWEATEFCKTNEGGI